jgi:hypothetical protein
MLDLEHIDVVAGNGQQIATWRARGAALGRQ